MAIEFNNRFAYASWDFNDTRPSGRDLNDLGKSITDWSWGLPAPIVPGTRNISAGKQKLIALNKLAFDTNGYIDSLSLLNMGTGTAVAGSLQIHYRFNDLLVEERLETVAGAGSYVIRSWKTNTQQWEIDTGIGGPHDGSLFIFDRNNSRMVAKFFNNGTIQLFLGGSLKTLGLSGSNVTAT